MRLTALPGGLELKTKRFDLNVGDAPPCRPLKGGFRVFLMLTVINRDSGVIVGGGGRNSLRRTVRIRGNTSQVGTSEDVIAGGLGSRALQGLMAFGVCEDVCGCLGL